MMNAHESHMSVQIYHADGPGIKVAIFDFAKGLINDGEIKK